MKYYFTKISTISSFIVIVMILSCGDAHAYIDPGTGALIWQLIVVACVGGLFYIKKFRNSFITKIKQWIKKDAN